MIDLVDTLSSRETMAILSESRKDEFISGRVFELGSFNVDTADTISLFNKVFDEMMSDESARAGNENGCHFSACLISVE